MVKRRIDLLLSGTVQGVGFRPYVYRLATSLDLAGEVRNIGPGVAIGVEGESGGIDAFLHRLPLERPVSSSIKAMEVRQGPVRGESAFKVAKSSLKEQGIAIPPDLATCEECLGELADPADRRYRYPFLSCTACGPRYSIVLALPYDRERTTMRHFPLCRPCRQEYLDPMSRRFHAETIACADCGPRAVLWDGVGRRLATGGEAIRRCRQRLDEGAVVALKGLGGFQLLVAATDEAAVTRLRRRKGRPDKPFAVMMRLSPRHVTRREWELLSSPAAPIVLVDRGTWCDELAPSVGRGSTHVGVMLPYTPLHHLVVGEVPVVATSGNRSGEPLCKEGPEALEKLRGIADFFLVHDRPIARRLDDSVAMVAAGGPCLLRVARGYAPLSIDIDAAMEGLVAVGGQQKSAVAAAGGKRIVLGGHLCDLDSPSARELFRQETKSLPALCGISPTRLACDFHAGYYSTRYAAGMGLPVMPLQHHLAHLLACMAEHALQPPVLGVTWDGTGDGGDGTVWGGEFLVVERRGWYRVASLRRFRLPGGEKAVREPRRSALGVLYECFGMKLFEEPGSLKAMFAPSESAFLGKMLAAGVGSPYTTSAGRLFDAVAALTGCCLASTFEAQGAMALEWAARTGSGDPLPLRLESDATPVSFVIDWIPAVRKLLEEKAAGEPVAALAFRFHAAMAEAVALMARRIGLKRVVLTGGCFQNRLLLSLSREKLLGEGFDVYCHRRLPPGDGGLAVGQAYAAALGLGGDR